MGTVLTVAVHIVRGVCARSAVSILAFTTVYPSVAEADVAALPPTPSIRTLPPWAQAQKPPVKRALVIGIDQYQYAGKLTTPSFDAAMVENTLKNLVPNFAVTRVLATQTTRAGLLEAIATFAKTFNPGEVAFVFFSGHGLERDGINYLVPADAKLADRGREGFVYISLPYLIEQIQNTGAGVSVIILDACRVDPFAGADPKSDVLDPPAGPAAPMVTAPASSQTGPTAAPLDQPAPASPAVQITAGLREIKAPQGFIVAYAAEPGKPSYSLFRGDAADKGSIFTRRLLNYVAKLDKPIERVFGVTGGDVWALTGYKQKPFVNEFDAGEVLLLSNDNLEKDEQETWVRTVVDSPPDQQLSGLRVFLSLYPAGPYTAAARARIQQLEHASKPPAQLAQIDQPKVVHLSGALATPWVAQMNRTFAVASHDVNVRAAPYRSVPKVITSLKKGDEVQVLAAATRPGWAKVILNNGVVGYVGSVIAQPSPAPSALSVNVVGDDMSTAIDEFARGRWRDFLRQSSFAVRISVGAVADTNPWRARQVAYLRALRLRAALIAQGVSSSRITLALGSDSVATDTASVKLVRGATK